MGYDAEWQVLNSKYFVPQNRERVFIIGHLRGKRSRQVFPLGEVRELPEKIRQSQYLPSLTATDSKGPSKQRINNAVVIGNIDTKGHNSIWGRVYDPNFIGPTLNANGGGLGAKTGLIVQPVLTPFRQEKRQNGRRFKNPGEPAFTVNTQDRHGIYDGMRIRKLTPTECERLQGFPDGWTSGVSDTQRYRQMGNAVTVPVVEYIAKELRLG
jgi:DNA (cytosine-5)-methyltransferase 1